MAESKVRLLDDNSRAVIPGRDAIKYRLAREETQEMQVQPQRRHEKVAWSWHGHTTRSALTTSGVVR